MPFKSEKQRRFLYAKHPEIAKRWSKQYGSQPEGKKMPPNVDSLRRRLRGKGQPALSPERMNKLTEYMQGERKELTTRSPAQLAALRNFKDTWRTSSPQSQPRLSPERQAKLSAFLAEGGKTQPRPTRTRMDRKDLAKVIRRRFQSQRKNLRKSRLSHRDRFGGVR